MEQITKEQWDRLNNKQKDEFQKNLSIEFENIEYPSYENIVEFLKSTEHSIRGMEELRKNDTPSVVDDRDINELWEVVINHFNSKR